MDNIKERIQKITDEMFANNAPEAQEGPSGSEDSNSIVDIYQNAYNARYEANKRPVLKGSRQKVLVDLEAVLKKLVPAYKRAKDDSECLNKSGDTNRAKIIEDQYVQEVFLPAVESLVTFNSVGEVLNCDKALSELDKYASVGKIKSSGYTASFVRMLHSDEDGFSGRSDNSVAKTVKDVTRLANDGNVRAAISLAKKMKDMVDKGEHIASKDDYELLQRVSLR